MTVTVPATPCGDKHAVLPRHLDGSRWTDDELAKIDRATELRVASQRPDGSIQPFVTIWHTTVGDALDLRSAADCRTDGSAASKRVA